MKTETNPMIPIQRMILLGLLTAITGISSAQKAQPAASAPSASASLPDTAGLEKMAERFAPTPLQVDTSALSTGDTRALVKLVEAARVLDHLFMQQLPPRLAV
jgi:hypothetical protein